MLTWACRSLIPLAFFGLIITGCNKSAESGGGKVVSNQPVDSTPGVRIYRVDPAIGGTLSAAGVLSADPKFGNASLVIPPGSLSIPVEISLFEAQSLVNPSTISSIGASNLTPAGPAVGILPSQSVSVMNPMSIALPYSAQMALTGGVQVGVIAIYPGQSKNELETFVGSELDFGTSGVVKLSISRFGAFQLVYSDGSLTKVKSDTDAAISQTISGATVGGSPGGNGAGPTVTPKKIFESPVFDGAIPITYKYAFEHRNAVIGDNKVLMPNSYKEPGADDSDSSYRPRLTMIDSSGQLVTQFGSGGHVVINHQLIPNGFGIAAAVDDENGRIYLAGAYQGQSKGFLAAMNLRGELITAFGTGGIVTFQSRVEQVEVSAGRIFVSYYGGIERLYLDGAKDASFNAGAAGENFVIDGDFIYVAGGVVYWDPYHEDLMVAKLNLATGALLGSKNIDMPGSREYGQLIFKHGDFLYVSARSTTESKDNQLVVKLNKNLELDSSFASGGLAKEAGGGACRGMVPLAADKLLFSCWGPWLLSTSGNTLDVGGFGSTNWLTLAHAGQRVVGVSNGRAVIYNNPFWSCQSSYESQSESCFDPNLGNVIATKSRTCNAAKTGFDYGSCTAVDLGVPQICTPSSSSSVSCVDEKANSSVASKTRVCTADGLGYSFGACVVTACASGFYLDQATGSCVRQICVPNTLQPTEDCKESITNSAVATRTKSCNYDGSGYFNTQCVLSSCVSGYVNVNNACLQQVCTPNGALPPEDCKSMISFSDVATRTKTCNWQGTDYTYGTCTVSSCNSGYGKVGNTCVPQICTPGSTQNIGCGSEIPNSVTASKVRTCNSSGTDYTYGSCIATACVSPYVLSGSGTSCSAPTNFSITGPSRLKQTIPYEGASIGTISWTASSFATAGYEVKVTRDSSCQVSFWSATINSTSVGVPLVILPGSVYICVSARKSNPSAFYGYDYLPATNNAMVVPVTQF